MRQIQKHSQIFSILAVPTAFTAMALLTFAPASLASPPATSWSIRNTGLSSEGACLRRARLAMDREDLRNVRTSGSRDSGLKGETSSTRAYIICQRDGARAYMFCAGDRAGRICDNLAQYMRD